MNCVKTRLSALLFVLLAAGPVSALAGYIGIALPAAELNRSLNNMTNGGTYGNPGTITNGGVPLTIANGAGGAFNIWASFDEPGPNPHVLDVPINVYGVGTAYTIMNLFFGQTGVFNPLVEFFGTGGAYYQKTLVVGTDIRDHFNGGFSNTINGTTTVEVYSPGNGVRLDRQEFDLPTFFDTETLLLMRISDSGGNPDGRSFIAALTVQTVPAPGTLLLCLLGALGLAAGLRARK